MTTPYPQSPPPDQWGHGQAPPPAPGQWGRAPAPPPPAPAAPPPGQWDHGLAPSPPPPGTYGQPTSPGSPAWGQPGTGQQSAIAITLKFFPLAWLFALFTPKVFFNGRPMMARWGRNVYPVPAGHYQVHVHIPYFLPPRVGPADLTVPLSPGQVVELEYRTPFWYFSRGALGPPPQKYNGVGIAIGLFVGFFAVFMLCILGIVILSAL